MGVFLVHILNGSVLVIILIGLPAVTSLQIGSLQILSASLCRALTLWGLGLAILANGLGLFLVKHRKVRGLYFKWALGFLGLLSIELLIFQGILNFLWLKEFLLWLRNHFH